MQDNDSPHDGGNASFWQDDRVRNYDYLQSLLSEKKTDILTDITRIVKHFCIQQHIKAPKVLDVGCGPGSPMTLSAWVLEKIQDSILVGVDSSEQMLGAANEVLPAKYGRRFSGFVSDFNSDNFWIPQIDSQYNFIISSGALHYLSDRRRTSFLREIFQHIKDKGVFVCSLANCSNVSEIAEMENLFRVEFTYDQLEEERRPKDFNEFRRNFEQTDRKANINWKTSDVWLESMRSAGFRGVDVVWHLWIRSIFLALK